MNVLVVDDEEIVLRSCRLVLEAEGCKVLSAASVEEALSILEEQTPNLLLIDVKMPVHDGMYLMRRVREKRPGIPMIVMSGYATTETIREAEDLGAATFIPKPFTPDELADTVRSVIQTLAKEKRHGKEKDSGD